MIWHVYASISIIQFCLSIAFVDCMDSDLSKLESKLKGLPHKNLDNFIASQQGARYKFMQECQSAQLRALQECQQAQMIAMQQCQAAHMTAMQNCQVAHIKAMHELLEFQKRTLSEYDQALKGQLHNHHGKMSQMETKKNYPEQPQVLTHMKPKLGQAKPKIDYFTFALQWEAAMKDLNYDKDQRLDERFTIHGFWPNSFDKDQPQYCGSDELFSIDELLKSELMNYWPSLPNKAKSSQFWKDQWEKHGSCANHLNLYSSVKSYFELVLSMFHKLNLNTRLISKNVKPSDVKPVNKGFLLDVIVPKSLGLPRKPVQLICDQDDASKLPYLIEIRFCYNLKLDLIACPVAIDTCMNDLIWLTGRNFK